MDGLNFYPNRQGIMTRRGGGYRRSHERSETNYRTTWVGVENARGQEDAVRGRVPMWSFFSVPGHVCEPEDFSVLVTPF